MREKERLRKSTKRRIQHTSTFAHFEIWAMSGNIFHLSPLLSSTFCNLCAQATSYIFCILNTKKKYIYKIPFEVPNFISTILFHLMKFIELCNHVEKSVHKELYSLLVHLSRQFCWILVASAMYFSFRFCFSLSLNWKRPQHLCTDRTITTTMNNGILFAGTKHCYGWYGMDEGCASVSVSESVPFSLFPTLSVYKCVSSNL